MFYANLGIWYVIYLYLCLSKIKVGTRQMGTFYIKYTNVSHTQNLADV